MTMKTTVQNIRGGAVNLSDTNLFSGLNESDLYRDLNAIFPDDLLFAAEGKTSVGVDTNDLSISSPSISVGVDTSDLPCNQEVRPPSSIISPPVTPLDQGEGKSKLYADDKPLDFCLKTHNSFGEQHGNVGDNESNDGAKYDQLTTPKSRRNENVRYAPHKDKGFSSSEDGRRRVWIRSFSKRNSASNDKDSRVLRPNPLPPSRYMGNSWRRNEDTNYCGYFEMLPQGLRSADGTESAATCTKISKQEVTSATRGNKRAADSSPVRSSKSESSSDTSDTESTDQQTRTKTGPKNILVRKRQKKKGDAVTRAIKTSKEDPGRNYICSICQKACATASSLKTHSECAHLNIRYRCTLCDYVCCMHPSMAQHFHHKHPEEANKRSGFVVQFTQSQ